MFALRDYMKSATQISWGVSVLDSPIRSSIQQPDCYGFRQSRDRKGAVELGAYPVVYLITFACYGGHLHGGISGSVDRRHNAAGTPILEADPARVAFETELMDKLPIAWTRSVAMQCWGRFRRCACIVAGVCWRPTCELITCTRWWKRRFRRSESWAISKLMPAAV